jgi:hypothetical protein
MFRVVAVLGFRLAALAALLGSAVELVRPLMSRGCSACVPKAVLVVGDWVVPLAWPGLGGALALLALSFCAGGRARRLRAGLSLVGGGLALGLLFLQVGRFAGLCPTCCLIDGAFVLAALAEAMQEHPAAGG